MFLANKLAGAGSVAKTYVDDVFSSYVYEGNGATQNVNTGLDLLTSGGLNWIKNLSNTDDNFLFSTTIPSSAPSIGFVKSNATAGYSYASGYLGDFTTTGFQVGTLLNASGDMYSAKSFKKAPKFMDVVSYTGNNGARTIAHSLGVAPSFIFIKNITTGTANWGVYTPMGVTYANYLNLTSGVTLSDTWWNSTAPTSTVFSLGADPAGNVNAAGSSYIAFLFANDTSSDGLIRCGTYSGNGTTTGSLIDLGWEPQWILIKSASTGSWVIIDTTVGASFDGDNRYSVANTNSNSAVVSSLIGIRSNGFQPISTDSNVNAAATTYMYMAIRRSNKPPTSASGLTHILEGIGGMTPSILASRKPDLLIAKSKTGSGTFFADRVRGFGNYYMGTTGKVLDSTVTTEESGLVGNTLRLFKLVGGSNTTLSSAITYSFVRATGFFDVVGYIGQDSANLVVKHNLGVAPQIMIIKNRTFTGGKWKVRVDLGSPNELILSTTDGFIGNFGITNVTASSFEILSYGGSHTATNGNKYIVYLFATLPGISKVGTYTGNGSAMTINCGFVAGAKFVMIKRTDAAGDWCVFDTYRGITDEYTNDPVIVMNNTAAETSVASQLYAQASGFNIQQNTANNLNVLNATYIFLAIA